MANQPYSDVGVPEGGDPGREYVRDQDLKARAVAYRVAERERQRYGEINWGGGDEARRNQFEDELKAGIYNPVNISHDYSNADYDLEAQDRARYASDLDSIAAIAGYQANTGAEPPVGGFGSARTWRTRGGMPIGEARRNNFSASGQQVMTPAQQQLASGFGSSRAQLQSMASSARGGGAALSSAARTAANQQGMQFGQQAAAARELRASEQMAAQDLYNQGVNRLRAGDASRVAAMGGSAQSDAELRAKMGLGYGQEYLNMGQTMGRFGAAEGEIEKNKMLDREQVMREHDERKAKQKDAIINATTAGVGAGIGLI